MKNIIKAFALFMSLLLCFLATSCNTGNNEEGSNKTLYELAVEGGYTGTEAEWNELINGGTGSKKTVYELAVEAGYTGTEAEWNELLNSGSKNLYELAVEAGYKGSKVEWEALMSNYEQEIADREMLVDLLQTKHKLKVDENGEFTVLVLSDIHIGMSGQTGLSNEESQRIKQLVDEEQPDLVLFDGDVTHDLNTVAELTTAISSLVSYIEANQIPWAHVYGNHDRDTDGLSREIQQAVYESFEYCVSEAGPEDISGVGNFVLPVYSYDEKSIVYNVWGLDSHGYLYDNMEQGIKDPTVIDHNGSKFRKYEYIKFDQIEWYLKASRMLENYNGARIPAMMAFHIPLQESMFAWELRNNSDVVTEWTGELREAGVAASAMNSGMFSAVVSRGDVELIVNGHEHENDFMVKYKGVMLCYSATPSRQGYCDDDMLGGRVIKFNQGAAKDITTYMTYDKPKDVQYSDVAKVDFEGSTHITLKNENASQPPIEDFEVVIVEGKGTNGSSALSVKLLRDSKNSNAGGWSTGRIYIDLPALSKVGTSQYLRVWIDMTDVTTNLDFRKAAFGFIDTDGNFYNADNNDDVITTFYALREGDTEWQEMSTGTDGCFGLDQNSSMSGFKGWLAFPLDNIVTEDGATAPADAIIEKIYIYHNIKDRSMLNQPFYIDDIEFVVDYNFD